MISDLFIRFLKFSDFEDSPWGIFNLATKEHIYHHEMFMLHVVDGKYTISEFAENEASPFEFEDENNVEFNLLFFESPLEAIRYTLKLCKTSNFFIHGSIIYYLRT